MQASSGHRSLRARTPGSRKHHALHRHDSYNNRGPSKSRLQLHVVDDELVERRESAHNSQAQPHSNTRWDYDRPIYTPRRLRRISRPFRSHRPWLVEIGQDRLDQSSGGNEIAPKLVRDRGDEPRVVGDEDDTSIPLLDGCHECIDTLDIEVVRRLIEKDDVRALHREDGERHTRLLASRKCRELLETR